MTCRAFIFNNLRVFILLTGKAVQHKMMTTDVWTSRTSFRIYETRTYYTYNIIYIHIYSAVQNCCGCLLLHCYSLNSNRVHCL
jgi:hypothetical protein